MQGGADRARIAAVVAEAAGDARELARQAAAELLGREPAGMEVVWVDAEDVPLEQAAAHLAGGSLLSPEQAVVIWGANRWPPGDQRRLAAMLRRLPDNVAVILAVYGEAARFDEPLVRELWLVVEQLGQVRRQKRQMRGDLRAWLSELAREHGCTLSSQAAWELVEAVGDDRDRLRSEIAKLATYVGDGGRIDAVHVRELTVPTSQARVWWLIDAIVEGKSDKAFELLERFMPAAGRQEAALQLIHFMARHLRMLWQARVLMQEGHDVERIEQVPEDLAECFPADDNLIAWAAPEETWKRRKFIQQAKYLRESDIARMLRTVYAADLALKGQQEARLDAAAAVELLVGELCRIAQQARRGAVGQRGWSGLR